jgi:hypothetical protein
MTRLRRAWAVHRDAILVAVASFAVRLGYNSVHPPLAARFSDMAGYIGRADHLFEALAEPSPQLAFYPFGTHALVGVVFAAFGRGHALSICYALLGAITATFSFLIARRMMPRHRLAARLLGAVFVLHVPWITSNGLVLSETPFACALTIGCHQALRCFDRGRTRHAFAAGLALALATVVRPQALVSLALLLVHALRHRALWPRRALPLAAAALAPVVLLMTFSALRFRHHTGKLGLVAGNGAVNFAFGRCHCWSLTALRTTPGTFSIGAFKTLRDFRTDYGVPPILELSPALGGDLVMDAELWDTAAPLELAKRCAVESGPLRQLQYSATHVMLLWAYNTPWPTNGPVVATAHALQAVWIPGLMAALISRRGSRRSRARRGLLTAHVWALLITAAVFFGEARLRLPYDGIIAVLSTCAWLSWRASAAVPSNRRVSRRPSIGRGRRETRRLRWL